MARMCSESSGYGVLRTNALSVLLHGASSQPLLQWYSRRLDAKQRKRAPA